MSLSQLQVAQGAVRVHSVREPRRDMHKEKR